MAERDTRFGGNLELANIGEAGIASLAKQQLNFDRSNREFARFHAKSDPTAQKWEQAKYEQYDHPEFINARSPRVFRNTQWSPNYPGPKFDTHFIVGANKSSEGLRSRPSSDYYQDMRERNKFHQSSRENEIRNMILGPNRIYSNDPGIQAGITGTNQGYKVWQAGGPFVENDPLPEGFPGEKYTSPFVQKYISRPLSKLFGNEVVPEEFDPMLNPDMHGGPPVDNEGNLLPGWELHQDGTWNYYPPEFEGDDAIMDTDILEAQSQWKRPENVRSLLDYIMKKIGPDADESDARKYIFDNFGLKLPQLSLGVNRGGIIGLI